MRTLCSYDAATIAIGASIAHGGPCLTVVGVETRQGQSVLDVDLGEETLVSTTLRDLTEGAHINLERSLRVGDELGGHMVSGHVDGVTRIQAREDFDGMTGFTLAAPASMGQFIAQKGSVALDGVSLTVNKVWGKSFSVLLIPHTLAHTTFGERKEGDLINIEVDQMARYAARLLETQISSPRLRGEVE